MSVAPSTASRDIELAYDEIAPFYDAFTAHHDYELWIRSLLEVVSRASLTGGNRLLDVGCGSGKSFIPMLARGWVVTACDQSSQMLSLARQKAAGAATLFEADVRELRKVGEFDLVWCLDDVLNYLTGTKELEVALAALRANLAADGLLLFDLNTLASFRGFFADDATSEIDGHRYCWRGHGEPEVAGGAAIEAVLEVHNSRGEQLARSVHSQRHFTQEEVALGLARAGLEAVGIYGHGPDARLEQPLDELRHTKAIVLATRR